MATKADGMIIIDTRFNTDDLNNFIKEAKSGAKSVSSSLSSAGQEIKAAFSNSFLGSGKLAESFGTICSGVASGVKKTFDIAVKAITAASTAISAASAIGLRYNSQMEDYLTNYTVLLGDAEKATQHVENLKKLAASTPFEITDLANVTQLLIQYGFAAQDAEETLAMLGDIAQGSSEKMNSIGLAYAQMSSLGKVTMQDVKQMINAGFNPLNAVAQMTGETMTQVSERMDKGAISVEEVTEAMKYATSANGQFYQSMEKASKTMSGQLSTLKDNVKALIGDMTSGLFDSLRTQWLPEVIKSVADIQDAYTKGGASAAITAAGDILVKFIKEIAKKIPTLISTGKDLLGGILDGIKANSKDIAHVAVSIGTSLVDAIKDIVPMFASVGRQVIVALTEAIFGEDIAQKVNGLFDKISSSFSRLGSAISGQSGTISDAIIKIIDLALDLASMVLPPIIDAVSFLIEHLDALLPILAMVATGIVAFKVVSEVNALISGLAQTFQILTTVMMANPLIAGVSLIAGLLTLIAVIDNSTTSIHDNAVEWAALTDEQQAVIDKAKEHVQAWNDMAEATKKAVEDVHSEYGYYDEIWERLQKITDEQGNIIKGHEEEAQVIANTLNDALGTEIEIIDGQIQGYKDLRGEIDKTIKKKEAEAVLEAYRDDYTQAIKNKKQAYEDYNNALQTHLEKQKQLEEIEADLAEFQRQRNELGYVEAELAERIGGSQEAAIARINELNKVVAETGQTLSDTEAAYISNQNVIDNWGKAQTAVAQDDVPKLADAVNALENNMIRHTRATEEQLQKQYDSYVREYQNMLEEVKNGSTLITEADLEEKKRLKELAFQELMLYRQGQKEINDGIVSDTKESVAEQEDAVRNMDLATPGSERMNDLADAYSSKRPEVVGEMQKTADEVVRVAGSPDMGAPGSELMTDYGSGISSKKSSLTTIMGGITGAIKTEAGKLSLYSAGYDGAIGMGDGLRAGQSYITGAASTIAGAALAAANKALGIASPSKKFKLTGKWSDIGLANGMLENIKYVTAASEKVADAALFDAVDMPAYTNYSSTGLNAMNYSAPIPAFPVTFSAVPPSATAAGQAMSRGIARSAETDGASMVTDVVNALSSRLGGEKQPLLVRVYLSGRQIYEEIVTENDRNTMATGANALAGG